MASKASSAQPNAAASSVRRCPGVACRMSWMGPIAMKCGLYGAFRNCQFPISTDCHPERAFLRSEGCGRATRYVAACTERSQRVLCDAIIARLARFLLPAVNPDVIFLGTLSAPLQCFYFPSGDSWLALSCDLQVTTLETGCAYAISAGCRASNFSSDVPHPLLRSPYGGRRQ